MGGISSAHSNSHIQISYFARTNGLSDQYSIVQKTLFYRKFRANFCVFTDKQAVFSCGKRHLEVFADAECKTTRFSRFNNAGKRIYRCNRAVEITPAFARVFLKRIRLLVKAEFLIAVIRDSNFDFADILVIFGEFCCHHNPLWRA